MVTAKAKAKPKARLGDRVLGFLGVRLAIFVFAAQAFLPGVLLDPAYKIAYYHDEHNVIMHEEVGRRAWADYHQVPAWNPWFCGGIVELSNAPSNVMAPDFLLRILYGTLVGRRLAVLFFVVLGMEGTFRYARRQGASAIGAAMGAVAFSTSGHFVSLLTWGWIFMFHYNLVPWVALSFEEGLRKRWWIVAGGFFIAWLVLGGGTYVVPYTALVLLLLWIYETARAILRLDGDESVRWYRPLLTGAGMGVVGLGLAAVRVLPLVELLVSHARPVEQRDQTGPLSIVSMLALPKEHAGWGAGAGEYYVGMWIFLLAVLAIVLLDRKAAKMWMVALVFMAFACGEFVEDSPYEWMRKLPVFSQLRFPTRMVTIAALFVAVAASLGLTRLEDAFPRATIWFWGRVRRIKRLVPYLPEEPWLVIRLAAAAVATIFAAYVAKGAAMDVVEHDMIPRGSLYVLDAPQIYKDEFRQARGNRWDAEIWPFASRGSLHCFEEHQLFESPYLRGDLPNDEFPGPETKDTKVERVSWSPHEIVLKVHAGEGGGRFVVNQNHAAAWKTDTGTLGSDGGLISVRVPAGDHTVTLTYSDWRVRWGGVLTFATIFAIAIAGVKRGRRKAIALFRWIRLLPEKTDDLATATATPTPTATSTSTSTPTATATPTATDDEDEAPTSRE